MRLLASVGRWLTVAVGSLVIVSALSFQTVGAVNFFGDVCEEGGADSSTVCEANGEDNLSGNDGIILRAANLIAVLAGIAAIIMIIIGGFMMMTAGGDSSRLSTAKKTITYALVGIVVISLARLIVGFVVTRVG
jgi:hypothetical protein